MNRVTVIISATLILIAAIVSVVVVTVTNHDGGLLIGFLAATIIPTVASLLAFNSAEHAKNNTNGLLHEQIRRANDAETKLSQVTNENTN